MGDSNPLRVLVVTNMWPTERAPMAGIFVSDQVISLREYGLSVNVLFVDGVSGGYSAYARGFVQVRDALSQPYDVIHAHYVFSGILAWGGRNLARCRTPIVLTQHGIETQVGWTAPLCRWTSARVEATVATSARVRQALRREDAWIIPCGVDTKLFRPVEQGVARRALGLAETGRLALFAGMRRPEKRLDLIEAAVELARRERGDLELVIADDVSQEQMPLYMNAADVLLLASEAEGSPMVVKEALACNLPVVSVDVGDVRELIAGVAGCAIVNRSAEDLARGLLAALSRDGRSDGRGVAEALSLQAIAAQLVAVYRSVYEWRDDEYSSKLQQTSRQSG